MKKIFLVFFVLVLAATVFAQVCGDSKCDSGENACTCPQDCGSCEGPAPGKSCSEFYCADNNQCSIQVLANCCGNDSCETEEDYNVCPSDCTPKNVEINILSPTVEKFFRGEKVLIKAKITADGRAISSPTVRATGFFGEIRLLNDGKHGDDLAGDNVFAFTITIPKELEPGLQTVAIQTEFVGVSSNKEIELNIDPSLELRANIKNEIELGQNIKISGEIQKKGNPAIADFEVKLFVGEKEVFSESDKTDETGFFEVFYHSSLLDKIGNWRVAINAADKFNNTVFFERTINAKKPEVIKPLNIELLGDFKKDYDQGEEINFVLQLVDDNQELLKNAQVFLRLPNDKRKTLVEVEPGKYARSIKVSREFKEGFNSFKIEALKGEGNLQIKAELQIVLKINSLPLKIELIEPSNLNYQVGEKMELRARVTDFEGELVNNAVVKALINGKEIFLELTKIGTYEAVYEIQSQDEGGIKIDFSAVDSAQNTGLKSIKVSVGGKEFFYDITQNNLVFGAVIVALLVFGTFVLIFVRSRHHIKSGEKKIVELNESVKQVQEKYFHEHSISKKEYKQLIEEIEEKLKQEKNKIREEKKQ